MRLLQLAGGAAALLLFEDFGLSEEKQVRAMKAFLNVYGLGFRDGEQGALDVQKDLARNIGPLHVVLPH
jgi:hypothetical protein